MFIEDIIVLFAEELKRKYGTDNMDYSQKIETLDESYTHQSFGIFSNLSLLIE